MTNEENADPLLVHRVCGVPMELPHRLSGCIRNREKAPVGRSMLDWLTQFSLRGTEDSCKEKLGYFDDNMCCPWGNTGNMGSSEQVIPEESEL